MHRGSSDKGSGSGRIGQHKLCNLYNAVKVIQLHELASSCVYTVNVEGIKVFVETRYNYILGGCCSYTRFQHDRHKKAIGLKVETLLTVLSQPKFSQNILRK